MSPETRICWSVAEFVADAVENVTDRYSHWLIEKSIVVRFVGPPAAPWNAAFPNPLTRIEDHRFVSVPVAPVP